MTRSLAAVLFVVTLLLGACSDSVDDGADPAPTSTAPDGAADLAAAPGSFYAVRDPSSSSGEPPDDTQIVEVETATGRVLRTVADLNAGRGPGEEWLDAVVGALDLAPDGRTLWYSAGTSVFRIALPDGTPEQMAVGHDPTVSPDGRRLAWIDIGGEGRPPTIRIRTLGDGTEQILQTDALSVEGYDTTWSADSTKLAFVTGGVDSFGVTTVDVLTGLPVTPEGTGELTGPWYTPYPAMGGVRRRPLNMVMRDE